MDGFAVCMFGSRKVFSSLLEQARGTRSTAEFTKLIAIDPRRYSRYVKGIASVPMTLDEIRSIADNSDVPFDRLVEVSGAFELAKQY